MLCGKSLLKRVNLKTSPFSEENIAFLGEETVLKGRIGFKGVLRLSGKFDGEIFECGMLIVGETAIVKGKVDVNTMVIYGLVEGEIFARERVEIHSMGKLYGNLITPIISINEGGIFEGHCSMEGALDMEDVGKKVIHPPRRAGVD
ncbi:MAG: hypothetical protein A2156_14815 [Deltaproteobacteria bacterium RBG_16_48_10]|nr:MAG: hypothetical protein A2156_14815 [Deltaproteobacteria bacterium RBG_16_48_10]